MKTIVNIKIPKEIIETSKKIKQAGESVYITGGCVRDLLSGIKPTDWDLTTSANPEKLQQLFEHTFCENNYGTVSVVLEECKIEELKVLEITSFRKESEYSDKRHPDKVDFDATLENDLARRDFTINALAIEPQTNELIDLHNGVIDLNNKVIRAVGDPKVRFSEDALRLMRAVRLATTLNFKVEQHTLEALIKESMNIKKIASERVRDEFVKIIKSENPMYGIDLLRKTKLIEHIIPEILLGLGVEQNQAHSYHVYEHNLRTLQHAAQKNLSLILRLAALFHDIGKPHTKEWSEKNKDWSFHQHDIVGSKIAEKILLRMKFSKEIVKNVVIYVRWHMFFSDTEQISLAGVRRMIARVGEKRIWNLIDLRMCDRIGTGRPKENPYRLRKYTAYVERVLKEPITPGSLDINGNEIIKITGLSPSPKVGQIINILVGETLNGLTKNSKEELIKRILNLVKLDDDELQKLNQEGKLRLKEEEYKITKKIFDKYKIKM